MVESKLAEMSSVVKERTESKKTSKSKLISFKEVFVNYNATDDLPLRIDFSYSIEVFFRIREERKDW